MAPKVSEEHMEGRRQQILDAAVACFSRFGFHGATIDHICQEAHLSRGAIYHYYKSKEDIIDALRARSAADDAATFGNAAGEREPMLALAQLTTSSLRRIADVRSRDPNRVAVFLWAEMLLSDRIYEGQISAIDSYRNMMEAMVRGAQTRGDLNSDIDPKAITLVITAALTGLQIQLAWEPDLDFSEAQRVLNAILAGGLWPAGPPHESLRGH